MLTWQITDFVGFVKATLKNTYGGNVVIPVNDSRTAQVTIDFWDPACLEVKPLSSLLKVRYDDDLVFWGQITVPDWGEASEDRLTITAHDPTFRLKHRNVGIDDPPVATGYTVDGDGMWSLIQAAEPTVDQATTYGVPGTGIIRGIDTTNPKSHLFKSERGAVIWDEFTNISEVTGGPDWNLRPVDQWSPGAIVEWSPGVLAELSFYAKRGVDRKGSPWHYGWGKNNCRVSYVPDGTQVINYEVRTAQGGPTGTDASDSRALKQDTDSWGEVGIMEKWTATDHTTDSVSGLAELRRIMGSEAQATIDAYGKPPGFFTIYLEEQGADGPDQFEAEAPPRYLTHFTEGDELRVIAKRGYFQQTLDGRCKSVTLTDDEKGRTTTSLEMVPNVGEGDFDES